MYNEKLGYILEFITTPCYIIICIYRHFQGIFYGSIFGLFFVAWVISGAAYYKLTGQSPAPYLELSTEGCEYPLNGTSVLPPTP